jgi:RHS repeat-associated protein
LRRAPALGQNAGTARPLPHHCADGTVGLAYDALGNRISAAESAMTTEYAGNNLNQYTNITVSSVSPWLISSPAYDGNGNTLSDGENAYAYDSLNRLVGVFTASNTVEYSYDALDRLVEKRVYDVAGAPVAVEQYTYDGADVLCEYGADGAETARYVLAGLDRPVRRTVNGVHYYYHADALGSVTEISDESGAWVESYTYDVFGAPCLFDASGNRLSESTVGNTTLFTGRRYESESGLYHYRTRFYLPKLGRFLQPDPIGYAGGINLYMYCGNNPVGYVDPWGLAWYDNWHYEGRDARNVSLPPSPNAAVAAGGIQVPAHMNRYHDNGDQYPEVKYIFPDGREAVYDGKTGELVTDPNLKGTYNYVNPATPSWNPTTWPGAAARGAGHFFADMAPYYLWGNERPPNPNQAPNNDNQNKNKDL